jgi:guanine deaminase
MRLVIGQVLDFAGDPFREPPEAVARHAARAGVLIDDGRIVAVGDPDSLRPGATEVDDHGDRLISPGFVDAHAHYPQTAIIASWGKRLIDWLNTYTFPEEARFDDPAYAAVIAGRYLDLLLANGTTTVCSFCTIHPESVDALFAAARTRSMRIAAGKTCMDRDTAPPYLRDTAQAAYDQSRTLLTRWHGTDRASYVITPRFSPTSTEAQLAALGALWAEHPDCLMQTHLSEQEEELRWVASLYPDARDYLDTYERHGLVGPGGLYGHAIWLTDREKARLAAADAALIHCPTSNTFIGSGRFDMRLAATHRVGLATDTGGGSSFSMLRTMAAAYEIGQLRGNAIHPLQLWWLATAGSARALRMDDRIGTLAPGSEADLVVIDLASTPAIAQATARAQTLEQALFPTIMMGDDRAIAAVYVAGRPVARAAAGPT